MFLEFLAAQQTLTDKTSKDPKARNKKNEERLGVSSVSSGLQESPAP